MKILIIEDTVELRDEIADWFRFEGFDTFMAENGKQGVEIAMIQLPDLILCDIMMPEMDGHEVLRTLRENASTQLIPFLFITALADRNFVRTGMSMGADDYITKPFTREELMAAVKSRLNKSELIREKSDEALEELRMNLITMLPHELRTPLNGIFGFGQMLKSDPESFNVEDLRLTGETISHSATRLNRLIQNYLLYAQIELSGDRLVSHTKISSPADCCREICEETAEENHRTGDLKFISGQGVVFMPVNEFSRIVEELCGNAFKFSRAGSSVTVECGQTGDNYIIKIADHGCGMSEEYVQKIGAYMQFDRKIREQQGVGLGLIISKKLVELYGGKFKLESEVGRGTVVTVSLPAIQP